jgi:hypothetical protein
MFLKNVQGDEISLGIEGWYQEFTGSAILRGFACAASMRFGIAANVFSKHMPYPD